MILSLHDKYTIAFSDCKKPQINNCFNEKTSCQGFVLSEVDAP